MEQSIDTHVSLVFHQPIEIEIAIKNSEMIIEKMRESIKKMDLSIVEPYLEDTTLNEDKYKFLATIKTQINHALSSKNDNDELSVDLKAGECIFGSTCKMNSGKPTKGIHIDFFRFFIAGKTPSVNKFGIIIDRDEKGIIQEMMFCSFPRINWKKQV